MAKEEPTNELLAIADELYALPLGEFTPERDARAKALKGTELAAPVKALRKPSLAAWVVNLLVRREADQVEQVLNLGASLREAQASMSAAELRELTKQRRQLTAAVTQQAKSLAREAGVKVTEAVAEQVQATLTAGLVDEQCGQAVRSGLLVTALSATGVDDVDLSGAVAMPQALGFAATQQDAAPAGPPELRVVPDPDADEKARAAAEAKRAAAQEAVDQAQDELNEATADVERLEAAGLQAQAEVDEVRRKLAELEESNEQIDDELEDAEQVRAEAEDALAAARATLEDLST